MSFKESLTKFNTWLKGYRTMIAAITIALGGVWDIYTGEIRTLLQSSLGADWAAWTVISITATFAVLRVVTSTPLGQKS